MKTIVVCSKNKSKNKAVEEVVAKFFNDYKIISVETNSGVSETPIGDEEGLLGCKNRILDARKQIEDADIYISMEGILTECSFGSYLCGWTMVFDKSKNEYFTGCSAKVKVKDEIIKNVTKDQRLSKVVADYTGSTDEKISLLGTNGMLTNGVYTRTDEFIDSVKCALSVAFKPLNSQLEI